eukprot:TRINITY_DN61747_c0_g1_i1.p3 TRINITY_DN61747_c0_g1~~TRINITY_DN61747_c0_g1_i1.p3  ORF type:complete len:140 (-),score=22.26 TRINITY_DN61747_c0_g1_i1:186-605(-)
MQRGLVGSEMCIRDSINAEYMGSPITIKNRYYSKLKRMVRLQSSSRSHQRSARSDAPDSETRGRNTCPTNERSSFSSRDSAEGLGRNSTRRCETRSKLVSGVACLRQNQDRIQENIEAATERLERMKEDLEQLVSLIHI